MAMGASQTLGEQAQQDLALALLEFFAAYHLPSVDALCSAPVTRVSSPSRLWAAGSSAAASPGAGSGADAWPRNSLGRCSVRRFMFRTVFSIGLAAALLTGAGCSHGAASSVMGSGAATAGAAPSPSHPALSALRARITDHANQHGLTPWAWWEGQLDQDPAPEQVALLCKPEDIDSGEFVVADGGRLRFVATVSFGRDSECGEEPRFGPMPQRLVERDYTAPGPMLRLSFPMHHEGYSVDLGIRGGHLVVVAEGVLSVDPDHEPDPPYHSIDRCLTEIERDWDRRKGRSIFAGETWDATKDDYQREWTFESNVALLSGCAGSSGPLPRHPYLFRRGTRKQVRPEDIDLRVGVIDAASTRLRLRIQLGDDHSIPAVDGSAAALQAADHLELWTRALGAGNGHGPWELRWGWLIGRDANDAWHVARHPGSQGDSPASVTVQGKEDALWIDLAWDSKEQRDDWFAGPSRALAAVAVDVDEEGKSPEAVVSTGTLHDGRPALTVLPRCVSPGSYPIEDSFVKIREL